MDYTLKNNKQKYLRDNYNGWYRETEGVEKIINDWRYFLGR